ncbi:BBSome complex member BBS1 isoform 2-T2 [Menidia menidia]
MSSVESGVDGARGDVARGDGGGRWLDAHYDPVAGLHTFSSCVDLADLSGDGESRLVVGDLGSGGAGMKLKVYRGTALLSESALLDLPAGLVAFFMDLHQPRVPAVAVASGPCVYVYKNLRPYFKFTLPGLEVNVLEQDVWQQVREGQIDHLALREMLEALRGAAPGGAEPAAPLSVRSLHFLSLDPQHMDEFVQLHKQQPIRRQTVITCIGTLKKSTADEDGVSCLVIGTESGDVFILDPEAFIILSKMSLPAAPTMLDVTGQFDVEFRITVACRNGCVYVLRRDSDKPKYCIELPAHPVGLVRAGKNLVVGCTDQSLQAYSQKGRRLWRTLLAAPITSMAAMLLPARGFQGVLVALASREVLLFRDQAPLGAVRAPDAVSSLCFGRYGREDGTLVMTTRSGGLLVKILKRTAAFPERAGAAGPPAAQAVRLAVPRKTQLYVDQTLREREAAAAMHRALHMDLSRLRLAAGRAYLAALEARRAPVAGRRAPLRLSAALQGLGPRFRLTLQLQNAAAARPLMGLALSFLYDHARYRLPRPLLRLPLLAPGRLYPVQTFVDCLGPAGPDLIKVFVLHEGRSAPLLTAHISMPASEGLALG